MKKMLLIIPALLFSSGISFGQFLLKSIPFSVTGLSNDGRVAGYEGQAGPYTIWNPDSGTTINIGGLAPGLGIGSQARFSDDGNFLSGTSQGNPFAEMARYDMSTQQWTLLGSLGFSVDSTKSGGFGISGDGNTVVGLSWADTTGGYAFAHGVAWNPTEGLVDLGSLFDSIQKSTRANAASYDGSVVVGWQDFNGPWKSAVWRKNPGGGYFPNEYLLIDSTGSATDEYNQLGECSCVSGDGNWIGGYGDYANNSQPWIWNSTTGVINLGSLPNTSTGYVSGINADGTMAVGWFDGPLWGDPPVPFIWTATSGIQNLNAYIQNVLGLSTGTNIVFGASCLSANGLYIVTKAIYATAWDNNVVLEADDAGHWHKVDENVLVPSLVNINTASAFELETLPGIGFTKAQAIIDYRTNHGNFSSLEALDDVPGIGPATINLLRGFASF